MPVVQLHFRNKKFVWKVTANSPIPIVMERPCSHDDVLKMWKNFFSVHAAPGFHCLSVGQTFISPIVTFGGWLLLQKLERDLEKESAVKLHTALSSLLLSPKHVLSNKKVSLPFTTFRV